MNCLILTAIRSGSTYLINMLRDTGSFSYPNPHSDHPLLKFQSDMNEFFAPNPYLDPWRIAKKERTKEECIQHLRYRLSFGYQSPVLIKVLMEQYRYYLLDENDIGLMESLFPDPKYIWLERKDRIARTVSAYLFFKSKVNHIKDEEAYHHYMSQAVEVDMDGLLDVYRNHVKSCSWNKYLDGKQFLKVDYENLVANPVDVLNSCLKFLEIDADAKSIVERQPKFRTERPESQEWIAKLRKEIGKLRIM